MRLIKFEIRSVTVHGSVHGNVCMPDKGLDFGPVLRKNADPDLGLDFLVAAAGQGKKPGKNTDEL